MHVHTSTQSLILHIISSDSREACPVLSAAQHSTQCEETSVQINANCNLRSVARLLFTLSEVLSQPCKDIKYLFATSEISEIFPV